MAGPVFTATVAVKDMGSRVFNTIDQSAKRFMGTVQQLQNLTQTGSKLTSQSTAAQNENTKAVQNATAKTEAYQKSSRDLNVTLLGMIKVMALFAVSMQVINVLMSPITFLKGAIANAGEFLKIMAQVNANIGLSAVEMAKFDKDVLMISAKYGTSANDIANTTKDISRSIRALNLGGLSEQQAVTKLVTEGAKAAKITGESASDATEALRTTLHAMQFDVKDSADIMSILWASLDVGTLKFKDIAAQVADFAPLIASLAPKNAAGQKEWFTQGMGIFATLSNFMPAAEAATGTNRLFLSAIKESKKTEQLRAELEKTTGTKLGLDAATQQGPLKYITNMADAIGRDSDLVKKLSTKNLTVDSASDAQLTEALGTGTAAKLAAAIFPNIRGLRPFLLLAQDDGKKVTEQTDNMRTSSVRFADAFAKSMDTVLNQWDRLKITITNVGMLLVSPALNIASGLFKSLADSMQDVMGGPAFDSMSTGQKITTMMNAFNDGLNSWWEHGGRDKIGTFTEGVIEGMFIFLQKGIEGNMDKIVQMGEDIAKGVVKGILGYFSNPTAALGSPILEGLVLGKLTGMGSLRGIAMAQLGQTAAGNIPGTGSTGIGGIGNMGIDLAMMALMMKGSGGGGVGGGGGSGLAMAGAVAATEGAGASGGGNALLAAFGLGGLGNIANKLGYRKGIPAVPGDPDYSMFLKSNGTFGYRNSATNRIVSNAEGAAAMDGEAAIPGSLGMIPGIAGVLAAQGILSGFGPFSDQGGIQGVIGSALTGSMSPSARQSIQSNAQNSLNNAHSVDDFYDIYTGGGDTSAGAGQGNSWQYNLRHGIKNAILKLPTKQSLGVGIRGALGKVNIKNAGTSFLTGALAGAVTGGTFGLMGGPFAGLTVPAGALIGGAIGGIVNTIGGARSDVSAADAKANAGRLAGSAGYLKAFNVGDRLSVASMDAIVQAGQAAGITNKSDMTKFIAFNLATIQSESSFDPKQHNTKLPDNSYGYYQLNANGGQGINPSTGKAYSESQLYDPTFNTKIGASYLAQGWMRAGGGSDIARAAMLAGHPGGSDPGTALAQTIAKGTQDFYSRATSSDVSNAIQSGGFTNAAGTESGAFNITVGGDLVLHGVNPNDMVEFAKALKKAVVTPANGN